MSPSSRLSRPARRQLAAAVLAFVRDEYADPTRALVMEELERDLIAVELAEDACRAVERVEDLGWRSRR